METSTKDREASTPASPEGSPGLAEDDGGKEEDEEDNGSDEFSSDDLDTLFERECSASTLKTSVRSEARAEEEEEEEEDSRGSGGDGGALLAGRRPDSRPKRLNSIERFDAVMDTLAAQVCGRSTMCDFVLRIRRGGGGRRGHGRIYVSGASTDVFFQMAPWKEHFTYVFFFLYRSVRCLAEFNFPRGDIKSLTVCKASKNNTSFVFCEEFIKKVTKNEDKHITSNAQQIKGSPPPQPHPTNQSPRSVSLPFSRAKPLYTYILY